MMLAIFYYLWKVTRLRFSYCTYYNIRTYRIAKCWDTREFDNHLWIYQSFALEVLFVEFIVELLCNYSRNTLKCVNPLKWWFENGIVDHLAIQIVLLLSTYIHTSMSCVMWQCYKPSTQGYIIQKFIHSCIEQNTYTQLHLSVHKS